MSVSTGREGGGVHLYYRAPDGVHVAQQILPPLGVELAIAEREGPRVRLPRQPLHVVQDEDPGLPVVIGDGSFERPGLPGGSLRRGARFGLGSTNGGREDEECGQYG